MQPMLTFFFVYATSVVTGVRDLGPARPPVLPDPAFGADGPEGRHLEAARFRRLRAQTGKGLF